MLFQQSHGNIATNMSYYRPSPQMHASLPEAVAADMQSLLTGDPKAMISVPMVHSTEQKRKRDFLLPLKRGTVTQLSSCAR
jgi:hypothetical protein